VVYARTAGDPKNAFSAVRHEVNAVDPALPIFNLRTMEDQIDESLAAQRAMAGLCVFFAILATLLAAIGLYGVMAYTVTRRTREIGIRLALGAQTGQVRKMVIGQGMMLSVIGVVIGLAAAFGLARLMTTFLFGVTPRDPAVFIGVPLLLAVVAFVAVWLPARRASQVDPIVALRYE